MIRIVICTGSIEMAQSLFKYSTEILKTCNVKCELSYVTSIEKVTQHLAESISYYDIFMLDALDASCLNLAGTIRSRNLIASIIFVAHKAPKIHNIIQYRPTAIITDLENTKQVSAALRYSCNEQLRSHPYFTVKNKDMLMRIKYDNISYFESRQRIVVMHTEKQVIEFYAKLTDVLSLLPQDEFVRCHQSYVVSMDKVMRLDKTNRRFLMSTGTAIEISKSYYAKVAAQYEAFAARH